LATLEAGAPTLRTMRRVAALDAEHVLLAKP
jgi:hypothetical protein